jgi:4-carboxymuconolactone decarboxylase
MSVTERVTKVRLTAPRVGPISRDDYESLYRSLFGEDIPPTEEPVLNITLTWGRHPALLKAQKPYQLHLRNGSVLPKRDQELVILRIGWLCQAEYEFGQHTWMSKRAGVTDEDVLRVTKGPDAEGWTPFESSLIRAVDELESEHMVSEDTWAVLAEVYDDRQLLDLLVVIGRYWTVSVVANSLGIQREPGTPGFPT